MGYQSILEITNMDYSTYLQDAIELVDAWEIPESDWAEAVNDQAKIMAGLNLEPSTDIPFTSPYHALQF
jgi:hypothetical protein